MRRDLPKLVEKLMKIEGIEDIGLTTNGVLLKQYAQPLYDAGLRRLNMSLDALDPTIFGKLNGRGIKPELILSNIDYAQKIGFEIKVNMVVQKGVNEGEILPMAAYFKERGITLRFIEFMDVGNDNGWSFEKVVTKKEIYDMICCCPRDGTGGRGLLSVKLRSDIVMWIMGRKSVSSHLFRSRFVRRVHGPGCHRMANYIHVCLRQKDSICGN